MVNPELLPGFEELAKLTNQTDDMAVESTIRMGSPESGDLAPSGDIPIPAQPGMLSVTLSRMQSLARKTARKSAPTREPIMQPGILVEMTTEYGSFNAGPADESKFNVPAGFKELKPPPPAPAPAPAPAKAP
jgi:hypothetical protein